MPNSPSAAKRMRQNAKRRKRNRVTKKVIKTLSKRTMTSLVSKDFDQALVDLKAASSKIDKAAARRKSKLARAYVAAVAKSKQA
jgi:small subunit ribosomal protein S20